MKRVVFGIFAHPDDEGFGPSGTLLQEVRDGSELHLVCATCGDAGMNPDNHPDLGAVRQEEWRKSGEIIGASSMTQLGYADGTLCNKVYLEIAETITGIIDEVLREEAEQVDLQFLTFEPGGLSGHLDHIAMSMITTLLYHRYKQKTPQNVANIGLRYFCLSREQQPETDIHWLFMPSGRPQESIHEKHDVHDVLEQKLAIMDAHYTQRHDAASIQEVMGDGLAYEHFYYPED